MPTERPPIYTIGYGDRTIEEFLDLLERYQIQYLLDVRSSPFSKRNPAFTESELKYHLLLQRGLTYGFFGDLMGGRPADSSCYYPNGAVNYDACRASTPFKRGLTRLRNAYTGGHTVVLMCSERKPQSCHRSKMIGVALEDSGLPIRHIDERGELKTQQAVMALVHRNQSDMFRDATKAGHASRGRYKPTENDP